VGRMIRSVCFAVIRPCNSWNKLVHRTIWNEYG